MRIEIGTVELTRDTEYTDNGYECAAWWQKVLCPRQTVPLFLSDEIGTPTVVYVLNGVVTDADFTSHFGGVAFGRYDKSQHVGKAAKIYRAPYAYSILDSAFTGFPGVKLNVDASKVCVIAYEFDHGNIGSGIKTHLHFVPIGKRDEVLTAWGKIVEYQNVREVPIPKHLTNIHKPRYSYHLRTKQYGCYCVTHDEIRRISEILAVPFHPFTIVLSDKLVESAELESNETSVVRYDRIQVKRDYLRSVVEMYGKDKKRLRELGFLPV